MLFVYLDRPRSTDQIQNTYLHEGDVQHVDGLPVGALSRVGVLSGLDDLHQLGYLVLGEARHVREHRKVSVADLF